MMAGISAAILNLEVTGMKAIKTEETQALRTLWIRAIAQIVDLQQEFPMGSGESASFISIYSQI